MIQRLKKIIYDLFFKKYQYRKIYMIGHSHILNIRKNYPYINNLTNVDYKIFSQNGEDGIIDYLLYQIKVEKPKFLEIGVGDFTESNTRYIFERCSPKGTIIDCINDFENKVKKNIKIWRGELQIVNKMINSKNILNTLNDTRSLQDLDLFSLDIDGIDYWIVDKLPKNFSKIAVLEFNPIFGDKLEVTVPDDINFNRSKYHYSNLCFGMSLLAAINIMKKKNFYFIGTNQFKNNAFFISNNYSKEKFFKNIEIQHENISENANFTESKNNKGKLNYLKYKDRVKEIYNCELIDLSSEKMRSIKFRDLLK